MFPPSLVESFNHIDVLLADEFHTESGNLVSRIEKQFIGSEVKQSHFHLPYVVLVEYHYSRPNPQTFVPVTPLNN